MNRNAGNFPQFSFRKKKLQLLVEPQQTYTFFLSHKCTLHSEFCTTLNHRLHYKTIKNSNSTTVSTLSRTILLFTIHYFHVNR